jgi:hypothetical protein
MEFRLTYEGELLASNTGERDTKPARKDYKHVLRQRFHPQIKKVFEVTPFLNAGTPSGPVLDGVMETYLPRYNKRAVADKHKMYGWTFLPLVTEELKLSCWLDVLFLRRQPRGNVWNHGDIDNRLKTLFDSLQIPDANQGYEKRAPDVGETPFHCLLQNDNLISKVTVETDQLLQDLDTPPSEHDARLIITVRLQPYEFTFGNIAFI